MCRIITVIIIKIELENIKFQGFCRYRTVLGKSAAVVMNLVKGLEHKNYDVYMDNYNTSVQLFLALADKGNWCMWHNTSGTIEANRKFFSKAAVVDEVKRQPRGTFERFFTIDVMERS